MCTQKKGDKKGEKVEYRRVVGEGTVFTIVPAAASMHGEKDREARRNVLVCGNQLYKRNAIELIHRFK